MLKNKNKYGKSTQKTYILVTEVNNTLYNSDKRGLN